MTWLFQALCCALLAAGCSLVGATIGHYLLRRFADATLVFAVTAGLIGVWLWKLQYLPNVDPTVLFSGYLVCFSVATIGTNKIFKPRTPLNLKVN
ncbi:MAG: hypothetical protein K2W95_16060 [Candidatus Obscuribacterales bacterium]|nr:hypothetical protein [Candidatus Obscuribacterales bacterium]